MTYVDLTTLKGMLGITDTARDTQLQDAIDGAVAAINKRCGGRTFDRDEDASARTFRTARRVAVHDDGELLILDDIATEDDLVVEVGSGTSWTTLDPGAYEAHPENALARGQAIEGLISRWTGYSRVRVTAVWGWPEVPADIATAARLQASRLFDRKNSPGGVVGSAEWGVVRLPHLDPDVRALIGPYILPGFG